MSKVRKGIVYIVTGKAYHQMALSSAKSVNRHNPNLPIHLFTDQKEVNDEFIDSFEIIENPHRRSKVDYLYKTPFDCTLFLDADTFILTDLADLFKLLDAFDLAIAHAHKRNHPNTLQKWKANIPDAFPQMNSGVILFKKNELTIQLLKDWQAAFHSAGFKKDQVTLRELIWLSKLRIHILPPEYNVRSKKYPEIWESNEAQPKILHYEDFTVFFKSRFK